MFILVVLLAAFFAFVAVLSGLYWQFLKGRTYWKDRNVPYKEPKFLAGNFSEVGVKDMATIFRELYEEGKNEKFFGVWQFTLPMLIAIDLELLKRIFVSDFSSFDDHGVYLNEQTDPLSVNLLSMAGASWRNMRTKLNPAFTAGKLKAMFPIIQECGEELATVLRPSAENQDVVEFKDLCARYTTDVISTCAFGIQANSMKDEKAIFRAMGKTIFQNSWQMLWRNFSGFLFPSFARFFKIRIYPKRVTDFFLGVMRETMTYRENNNVKRSDILDMLIQLKNEGFIRDIDSEGDQEKETLLNKEKDRFDYQQAAAQAFIFFSAGFDTSSTALQYALYELAVNPEIQTKVRTEIREVIAKNGGTLTYDVLQKMTYLSRVFDEILRKYPPAPNISRVCSKEYKVPGTETVLEKGTQVTISVLGLHWDDRYYPEPEKFDPDRFTDEQKALRPPFSYLPFGDGPRTCIGQRFGLTQMKVGLISIITKYEISTSPKTSIPPVYDPKSFFCAPLGGMNLKISLLKPENN